MKDKIKILFVSQYFFPENFKGNDIVFDFVKRGYDLTVLTAKPNYPKGSFFSGYTFFNKRTEMINGAKIIRTPIIPRGKGNGIMLILNYISFVFFSYFTCLFRVREKFDLIFVQQLSPVTMAFPGLWIKRKQKIPMITWVLDLWPESLLVNYKINNKLILNLINRFVSEVYQKSDHILISSSFFKDSILEKCKNKDKRITYFPNWAEDVYLESTKSDFTLSKFPNGFNVLFAGNLGESQDFESILESASLTREDNINWLILGEGRKSLWIRKEIDSRGLKNVFLLGRYPLETMPIFFKEADAMLVSLKDEPVFELTVPAKIQAYLASKKMLLGMLNGEGNDLINKSKSGIAVPAGNFESLAKAAKTLSKFSKDERFNMEKNGHNYYQEHFSKNKLYNELEGIILNHLETNS